MVVEDDYIKPSDFRDPGGRKLPKKPGPPKDRSPNQRPTDLNSKKSPSRSPKSGRDPSGRGDPSDKVGGRSATEPGDVDRSRSVDTGLPNP